MSESFDYPAAAYPIPAYKTDAHRRSWEILSRPGSWWTGTERIAIAEASRAAARCELCAHRKVALSPMSVNGTHDGPACGLDTQVVDAIHRITTDPARLTRHWVEALLSDSFGYGHYVELVSVLVSVISIDTFHQSLGLPLAAMPVPSPGDPDGYLPPGAEQDVAWVPMIWPANLGEEEQDLYFGTPQMGHVIRAMSLVPEAVRWLHLLSEAHYLPTPQVADPAATGHLCLSRMQTELVAARTSRLNDCFY